MVETLALVAKCLLCSETAILTGLFGCRNSATDGGSVASSIVDAGQATSAWTAHACRQRGINRRLNNQNCGIAS